MSQSPSPAGTTSHVGGGALASFGLAAASSSSSTTPAAHHNNGGLHQQLQLASSSDIAVCQSELLRQKVVFEAELRSQKALHDTQLAEVNELLKCREIDCRNLQAVVTILGRKLDSLTRTVEDMQEERRRELRANRYPPSSAARYSSGSGSGASAPSATTGSGQFQRSGSLCSHASSVVVNATPFSAFGRSTAAARSSNAIGTTPTRRGVSPLRNNTNDSGNNYAGGVLAPYMNGGASGSYGRTSSIEGGGARAPSFSSVPTSRAASATRAGNTTVPTAATAVPQQSYVVSTRAPVGAQDDVEGRAASAAGGEQSSTTPSPGTPTGGVRTTSAKRAVTIRPAPIRVVGADDAANNSSTTRPPSPRSMAAINAYKPLGSMEGCVGLRGPPPTRVTPEKLRKSRAH